ncbi:MAG TPA: FAD-dependent oxidoreductase [Solirubrobacterales bacterium]|jgi:3-phenylpropionate/trans-cinnamate dioxygenase ferredoxin reductase subunit
MAARKVDYLLVGGFAAAHCAAELRKRGADGSILLVGREPHAPYERPPLSKEYLRGEAGEEDALVNAVGWYEENGIELLTETSVMSLDAEGHTAKLQTKEEVEFGGALIATGARVNILHHLEGARLEGIHYLRVLGNSDAIREEAAEAEHVVLIGGSYIASEVAASLTAKGTRCTMVMLEEVALSGAFGEEVGRYFHEVLASHGVELVTGDALEAFLGDGRVRAIRTKSGREVEGDVVVVGAGVHPETMLAERGGLEVDDGIICGSGLESSVEGIFAAGDACSYDSVVHGRRLRVEHWDVALQQGQHAARGLMGDAEPYRVVPYFFSDLADWASLEYVGPAERWDELVWRGDRDGGEFSVWYLDGGRLAAALSVGRSEDLAYARALIESGADVSRHRDAIADVHSDLDAIA